MSAQPPVIGLPPLAASLNATLEPLFDLADELPEYGASSAGLMGPCMGMESTPDRWARPRGAGGTCSWDVPC